MNTHVGRQKTETVIPELNANGTTIFNDKAKLNHFCAHFSNNPLNLKTELIVPEDNTAEYTSLYESCSESDDNNSSIIAQPHYTFRKVTAEQVASAISYLKSGKPSGEDGLPIRFFKACAEQISPHFSKIINEMVAEGVMPTRMKIALVTPLYKNKGEKSNVKNYRPISILPTASKIVDKILYDQLIHFFEEHEIIMQQQNGYRANRSTQSAVTVLND